jgi:hypothetical protein
MKSTSKNKEKTSVVSDNELILGKPHFLQEKGSKRSKY